jgi:tetratricopeptide (TPR) repeat protein
VQARENRRSVRILLTVLLCACALPSSVAHAEPPTAETLAALGSALRSPDQATRNDAIAAFAALSDDALPALTARVLALRRERRTHEDGYRAINDFGRAAGATLPSDAIDPVLGLAKILDTGPSALHARVAERLLVLRALERIGTARAVIAMLPLLTSDMIAFRWEARHLVHRMGRVTIAALIRAAQHPAPEVDLFAGWAFSELGVLDAGHAVQDQSAESLAEIIRAYSEIKHLGAMPMVASFVGDDRPIVRDAAHAGMLSYAENGIWQLRSLHVSRLGRAAATGATYRDLLARVESHADERRAAPFRARIAAAEQAFDAGRIDEAVRLSSEVEARAPSLPDLARLAKIHATAAAAALAKGDLDDAHVAYRRALLLSPSDPSAAEWTTRLTEIETARLARAGIEPWPDAPVLEAARTEAPASRTPSFALAIIGLALLLAPKLRAFVPKVRFRMPSFDRARSVIAQWRARARVESSAGVERVEATDHEDDEESTMDDEISIATPVAASVPDAAREARERLRRAAEMARSRLSSPVVHEAGHSVRPPAPVVAREVEVVVPLIAVEQVIAVPPVFAVEAAIAVESVIAAEPVIALETAHAEPFVDERIDDPLVVEPAALEPSAELAEPEHARPAARRVRPTRRATLSPELVFGAAAPVRKRAP